MGDPKLILLDEPSTGLDPKSKRGLWSAISARKKNASLILTTHSMEEAEALCNRIVRDHLRSGMSDAHCAR